MNQLKKIHNFLSGFVFLKKNKFLKCDLALKYIFCLFLTIFIHQLGFSSNYNTYKSGKWNANGDKNWWWPYSCSTYGTWAGGGCGSGCNTDLPGGGDDVSICASHTVTVTSSTSITNVTVNGALVINTGQTLTMSGTLTINNGASVTLNGTGAINITGNVIINSGGFLTTNNTSTMAVGGNWTNNGGTFTPDTSAVTFNGTSAQAINGSAGSQVFYNVVVLKTAGQTLSVSGSTTTLTTNNLTLTTGNFTAPATLNINSTATASLTLTAGTFTAGTNVNIAGNWTNNGGTFASGTNTVNFTGTGVQAINGTAASQTFYNIIVLKTAGQTLSVSGSTTALTTNNLTLTTGNFTPPATLTINGNTILTSGTFTAGTDIYIKGNWTNNGGAFIPGVLGNTVTFNGGVAQFINGTVLSQMFIYLTVDGASLSTGGSTDTLTITKLTVNSGSFTGPVRLYMQGKTELNGGTYTAGANISTVGIWTNNGGAFIPGTSTVTFIGATPKTVSGTSVSQTFYNVVLNGAGVAVGGSTTELTVNNLTQTTGDFTGPADTLNINGNYTRTSGNFIAGANINIKGNWSDNGGSFTPGTSTVKFTGTGAQAINGSAASQTFYNVIVAKTAGQTLSVSGSTSALTTQNLTQTTGNFTAPTTLTINGNTLVSNGTFTAGTNIYAKGNWSKNGGTFTPGTGAVIFNSVSAQTIGGSTSTAFNNLTLYNTFVTSPQITMTADITVNQTLTMTAGNVNLSSNTITIGTSAGSPGSLNYTAGWIYGGDLKRYFNTSALAIGVAEGHFPIGSAYDYRPFWVSHTLSLLTGGSITVSHTGIYPCFRQTVNFMDLTWGLGTTVKYLSESYWNMSMSGIASALSVFRVRAEATGLGVINNVNDLNLSLSSGVLGLFSSSGGTIINPQVNRTGLSITNLLGRGTNTFYVGSKSNLSPLPISLLKFDAHLQDNQTVVVSWVTASETNNDYFTVEKSTDAINFEKVISIKGAGNSTMLQKYNTIDYNPLTGQSYYRLKQNDFDGKYSYSNIVTINKTTSTTLTIFPNPATDNDDIKMSIPHDLKGKEVLINVHDLQGQNIYSKSIIIDNAKENLSIISEKLNSGSYMINIISGNNIYKKLLIVR